MARIVKKDELSTKLDLQEQIELRSDEGIDLGVEPGRVIRKQSQEAFNEAKQIIEEARRQAEKIKVEAKALLGRVEDQCTAARNKGYAEGREQGLAEVTTMLTKAKQNHEALFQDLECQVVQLVYDISEKIIGRDLHEREAAILDLIRQALHAVMGQKIVILVHPADLQMVREHQANLMHVLDASRTIQIRADDKVKPKGCLIETEVGTIDAQLETQLQAIKKALGLGNDGDSSVSG